MNSDELRIEMLRNKERGGDLAKALGITDATFSNKLNANGAEFTQREITTIKERYNLTPERVVEIFFA